MDALNAIQEPELFILAPSPTPFAYPDEFHIPCDSKQIWTIQYVYKLCKSFTGPQCPAMFQYCR